MSERGDNLTRLFKNSYPGRGIVMGVDESGRHLVQLYFLEGRSPNSRNRVFERVGDMIKTAPADPSSVEDVSLTIYTAMARGTSYVVSNGKQTDDVARVGPDVLSDFTYEPDPSHTPRITGWIIPGDEVFHFNILRKSPWDSSRQSHTYTYDKLPAGMGMCIHTYMGDGNPLPSFVGEPYPIELRGHVEDLAGAFAAGLSQENFIAVAVRAIDLEDPRSSQLYMVNKYKKVYAHA